jgi:asparagine synthase (glutamine-hydrolysing)
MRKDSRQTMCGIAGLTGDFVPKLIERMNCVQAHRGPDGQGVWEQPQHEIGLGHVRLAILDLSDSAAQPMHSADGRFVLTFNGEIYNFRELRQRLIGLGHQFFSSGDTEVLLAGLGHWGDAFIKQLNGIFAFALWDNHKRELLLARDPLGVKPLYYAEPTPGSLLFASEIKALLAHPRVAREPEFIALQQHLAYGHTTGEKTALRGVRRLAPGEILRWSTAKRSYTRHRYWNVSFEEDTALDRQQATEQLRDAIVEATERQLVSDVPTGTFLSGGLDSSLLTVIAARKTSELKCYTTSYSAGDNRLDQSAADIPHARRLAEQLHLQLREIQMTSEVASLLPTLVRHLDEPIADPAAIACYLISKLASDHGTKVLLSGQGADELLAGYPRYPAVLATSWLDGMPRMVRNGLASMAGRIPGAFPGPVGATMRRGRRVLSAANQGPLQRFLSYCSNVPTHEIQAVMSRDVRAELQGEDATAECLAQMQASSHQGVDQFLRRDQSAYLPNHNLMYTDKMSMAAGVEVRVPFLDNEVVRLINKMPHSWKIQRYKTKVILRDASRTVVPDSIIDRKKAGFGAPYRTWLRNDLEPMWNDLLSEDAVRSRGWFDYDALTAARERSQAGQADLYMLQWAVLTTELWARQFIDANPAEVLPHESAAKDEAIAA